MGMNCKTKEDFDAFTRKLMAKVTDFEVCMQCCPGYCTILKD